MFVNAYEQMAMGVSDITSIALVTLEVIHSALDSWPPLKSHISVSLDNGAKMSPKRRTLLSP